MSSPRSGFEPFEQGEGVGRGAGETADDIALAEAAHLAGIALDHRLAQAHLPITADDDLPGGFSNPDGTVRPHWLGPLFWGQISLGLGIALAAGAVTASTANGMLALGSVTSFVAAGACMYRNQARS